jgi:hypothetical protein
LLLIIFIFSHDFSKLNAGIQNFQKYIAVSNNGWSRPPNQTAVGAHHRGKRNRRFKQRLGPGAISNSGYIFS